jgi:hypothetical protein
MPQKAWSAKRERQYVHIKEGLLAQGKLRNEARQRGLKGRSTMNKAQLEAALTPRMHNPLSRRVP